MCEEHVTTAVMQESAERRGPNLTFPSTKKFILYVYHRDQLVYLAHRGELSSRKQQLPHGIYLVFEVERA
jgi:hypothetical protein